MAGGLVKNTKIWACTYLFALLLLVLVLQSQLHPDLHAALGSWRQMNPLAPSCSKNTGKPKLLELFMLLQEGKSERYCAIQISQALTRNFPARIPQKTKHGLVAPEVGAATPTNPERHDVANAITSPTNNPIYKLIAKQAKERLMSGCTFDEFLKLTNQEQRTRLPGFTELSAVCLAVNDGRSAEEKKKLNKLAVKQMNERC